MNSDIQSNARELMKGFCRVCPHCNGKACAGEVPGMGGIGTGSAFQNNYQALADLQLNMTALHDVKDPDTSCQLFRQKLRMPILAAPIGGVSFNMSKEVTEEAYTAAVLQGCHEAGTLGCSGDGVPAFVINAACSALSKTPGIAFIKPWEGQELFEKLERVLAFNPIAVGMDIDAAGLVTLRKMGRPVKPMTVQDLTEIIRYVHTFKTPFIVKGIMTPQDAEKAVCAGADALVVSNHGGRVLDYCPGTASVMPAITHMVKGQTTILVDGAVRTGVDVLKMLALGADAVLVGRPVCVAAIGGGVEGVKQYFESLQQQLYQAMLLTGCASIAEISSRILFSARS